MGLLERIDWTIRPLRLARQERRWNRPLQVVRIPPELLPVTVDAQRELHVRQVHAANAARCTHWRWGRDIGTRCVRVRGHAPELPHLYRCAGPACPGYPWAASERPHPQSCNGPVTTWRAGALVTSEGGPDGNVND